MNTETGVGPRGVRRWWYFAVAVAFLAGYVALLDNPVMVDEVQNSGQVSSFAAGNVSIDPLITMIPGYHLVLAFLCAVTGWESVAAMRFFTMLISGFAVGAFFASARAMHVQRPALRTLQFSFLPVMFPYFLLIYTDVLSVLLVLLLLLSSVKGRFTLAGAAGLLACVVRQNNIIWVGFAAVMAYLVEYGWHWRPVTEPLRRFWSYVFTGALFVVFVFVNRGVAVGDTAAHPSFSLHMTNVWFLLFISFFLFLPLAVAHRREIAALFGRWWVWATGAGLFALFALTFVNDHPYNIVWGEYYLRNRLLIFFSSSWLWKTVFFVPAALAVVFFSRIRLRPNWWLLYPATVLFLLPSWLVEHRYYLIPLTLFLLVRASEDEVVERAQLAWFVTGSVLAFLVIDSGRLFL